MNNPMHALASAVTEKFIAADPTAAAKALETLATHEVLLLISSLKAQVMVAVLNPMDPPKAAAVLRRLPLRQASYVLARLNVPQAAKLMKEFSAPYRERISAVLEPAFVKLLADTSCYGPQSVGRVMNTDFVAVRTETKLSALIERLKTLPRKKLPLLCLVTGKDNELKGVIRTAELAFYNTQSVCGSVMSPLVSLLPTQTFDQAQAAFAQAECDALPVTNQDGLVLGILAKTALPTPEGKKSLWEKLTR